MLCTTNALPSIATTGCFAQVYQVAADLVEDLGLPLGRLQVHPVVTAVTTAQ